MRSTYEPLRVFLSFARDVREEVSLAEEIISKINARAREPLGLTLEATTWKEMPPITPAAPNNIQDEINEKILDCHIFVLVLYRRYGSSDQSKKSNLEEEVELALKKLEEHKKIMFLAYFRELDQNRDPGPQEQRVIDFRERLRQRGVWFHEYTAPRDFADRLTHDLYETLLRYRFSTQKHKALNSFWSLGQSDRPLYAQLALIYPPVDRSYLKAEAPDHFWLKRLVPHLVFEDYKALQKIEKTLRLINFRRFRTFTVGDLPSELEFMNRVWLCWPRNQRALRELQRYTRPHSDRARFHLVPARPNSSAKIHWRHSTASGSGLVVRSPLSKYLELQRRQHPGGEWNGELGRIVAKDYAILARFTDRERKEPTISSAHFKDYFFGGIRGLGTWGAGWFLDRRYSCFKGVGEDEDIQLLLEVTYRHARILEVRDVSSESESYFRKANSIREIRRTIEELGQP